MQPGIYLLHKPPGPTSFSLVQQLAAEAGRLKLCHGGALDPFASGLLPILAGQATRLMELLHPIPKRYLAEVRWGAETDNGDPLGQVTHQGDPSALTPARLEQALAPFLGWQEQVPPATSNKRIRGERAYVLAHRGEQVELPPSRVYLHQARWLSHDLPRQSTLELCCRGGYYVRSLARDLGRALGCFAHLGALQRTAIGPWVDPPEGERPHISGAALLPWCASRLLTDRELGDLRQEQPIERGQIRPPDWTLPRGFPDPEAPIRGLHQERLVALLAPAEGQLRPAMTFRGGL
jgi:tRNA pseudouridine55 synthase